MLNVTYGGNDKVSFTFAGTVQHIQNVVNQCYLKITMIFPFVSRREKTHLSDPFDSIRDYI